jgi:hypothetical protein
MLAILASEVNHVGRQSFFIFTAMWRFALCRTMLAEHPANPALANIQRLPDMFDTRLAASRA